jgi:hypothetical protein
VRLFRNNAFVLSLFLVLIFVNAHAITAGWYR